ncbi:uncharacterized protein LOC124483978 isoform X1 [Hypomesus transpacificus]|uniref:uncharacterized protein LOC124483978 isoform X1 n=1 Tax=Hypomesus transpacificus TaxID=137520 RepID=UPI001F07437F|nr:uncharacterized protein LOC124483978 isoform X1 [Hypomesus transpacificus]
MNSPRQNQALGSQARGAKLSIYPPEGRPLGLFRLQPGPSFTTHQKMADMWTQYNRQRFQSQGNRPRNPQKGRTIMSTMLESVRERGTKTHMETQAPPPVRGQQTHGPPQHPTSEPGEGRTAVNPSGHKQVSLCVSRGFNQGQGPAHLGQPKKEAWSQATVDPGLGDPAWTKEGLEGSATHLPHIGSGEESKAEPTFLQDEGLRLELFRQKITLSTRHECQINKRLANRSHLMHLGMPFDGVTTYRQSYIPVECPPKHSGARCISPQATVNWHQWGSEYSDRYQGPGRYLPSQRKPPSGLKAHPASPDPSGTQALFNTEKICRHLSSEYQRQYNYREESGPSRPKTSPVYSQHHRV